MGLVSRTKKYNHLKGLIAGNVKSGNPVRDQLIVSDATRTMAKLLAKYPELEVKEEPKQEVKEKPKKKEKVDGRE